MRTRIALWLPLIVAAQLTWAHDKSCEVRLGSFKPVTLRTLRDQSRSRIQRAEALASRPQFDNLEIESKNEQVGEVGPLALQQELGVHNLFVATPEPTTTDVATIGLIDEVRSFPVHVDIPWHGHRTTTTVFASLPRPVTGGDYLVGAEYPAVLVHLHGGGTPSATGKNGVNIGEKLMGRNIPVLSPTLPGHGRATRNPDGLLSFREQADWLLQMIDQLVDPRVKVILSGHSWGGMFAVYMQRLSNDPKYARISHYISLSPGVDTSMGGTAEERVAFDQWWEKNFPQFKDRIAAADFEFQENVLSNGKEADIPSYFTGVTSLDYSTPPLTADVMKTLRPLTVVVGSADGVVYVGREAQFQKIFGDLSGDSSLIVLGPGRTWKSQSETDLIPTGHNVFDRYIDGTTTPQVYSLVADIVEKTVGHPFAAASNEDRASQMLDQYLRYYANFIAFRELVDENVEYVAQPTEELAAMSARKVAIDDYLRKVEDKKSKAKRMADERVTAALTSLRSELGITDSLNADRARSELAMGELTAERKLELEKYLQAVEKIDGELKGNYADPQAEAEIAKLEKEFAKSLQKIGATKIEDYQPALTALTSGRPKDKEEDRLRSDLGRLHQRYMQIQKAKQNRFGLERDARMASVPLPKGISDYRAAARELRADRSPERRQALEKFLARVSDVEASARAQVDMEIAAQVESIPKPEGIRNLEEALLAQQEASSRMTSTYVPPGSDDSIRRAALMVRDLEAKVLALNQGTNDEPSMEKLESTVRELRDRRAGLAKRWDALWEKDIIQSPRVNQAKAAYEHTLASFKEVYFSYEAMKSAWLIELKAQGRLQASVLAAQTPQLLSARRKYQHAKKVFLEARERLEQVRREDAEAGVLEGQLDAVKSAAKIAADMAPLSELLRAREDHYENRRQRLSVVYRQLEEQKYVYALAMKAAGQKVAYSFERVVIFSALNRPLNELLSDMRTNRTLVEAMTRTLSRWENFLTELRRDSAANSRSDSY